MNSKLVALLLAIVVVAGGVGAYAVLGGDGGGKGGGTGGGTAEPPAPAPQPEPIPESGAISATGYSASFDVSLFGTGLRDVRCPANMTASVSGSSVDFYGIPDGRTELTALYSDGRSATFSIDASAGSVSIDVGGKEAQADARFVYQFSGGSDWAYWTGNLGSPGVTDSATPITSDRMKELWKVQEYVDGGSSNWKTPGSAVCVGSYTYYYNAADSRLHCVVTSTGEEVLSVFCESRSVYNMAIAYGDGKIFLPAKTSDGTVLHAYDAYTLKQLFVSEPVSGGELQGAIVCRDGKVFFGTYEGAFACFDTTDTDSSRGDETVSPRWLVQGEGWYNMVPAFFDGFCVIVEKGYSAGGATAHSVDIETGAVLDSISFDREYCVAGPASNDDRVFIPLNRLTDRDVTDPDSNSGKTLTIRSYAMGDDGSFKEETEKTWFSSTKDGGTQSIPVIWNGRMYIGGGGATLGSNEPFTVIDVESDGTMTTAYTVPELKTKGTATITTAYSGTDGAVYIYLIEYGKVKPGEASTSTKGSADIFCLRDSPGQKRADIVFKVSPSVDQFAYQSFTISPDGYLLIRNDSTLLCYGDPSRSYEAEDLEKAIARILSDSSNGNVNAADVLRAESRYSAMSDSGRASVSNYADLQSRYRTVTFVLGEEEVDVRLLIGSKVLVPPVSIPDGKSVTGWTCDGRAWSIDSDRVAGDMRLIAITADSFDVEFDSNGGSDVAPVEVAPGRPLGYVPEPVRAGYTFDGWMSGDTRYVPQETVVSSDLLLKAVWLKDSTVKFDPNGGTISEGSASMTVTQGRPMGELPVAKLAGYTFAGWYSDGVQFTAETIYPYDSGITLKAKWVENQARTVGGNGFYITGDIPEDFELSFAKMPDVTSKQTTMLKEAAGGTADCFMIGLYGDGLDSSKEFKVQLPVGKQLNGKTVAVHYYISNNKAPYVETVEGVVEDGVLEVSIKGSPTRLGMEFAFSIQTGTDLKNHEVMI